ncbi:ABC-2 type transport system permease protein [Crossiella equi]|uniref:Transport permease protein n=1 Tax=Crossiella equi TaxID=130796 RepID=A0ABS5A3X5_9PSEU|nr:ABC transporter permease [Crossiella equi]MBP2471276.1 ABC-2 type transport system permease protein [Crossiella equi]
MNVITATGVVYAREMRPTLRNPMVLVTGMVQPVLYVVLFGPLLTMMPIPGAPAGSTPWAWFIPGMLVFTMLFGTAFAGADLMYEQSTGTLERLLASPVNRVALLVGQVGKQLSVLLAQAVLLIVLVLPFGLSVSVLGTVLGLLLLLLLAGAVGIGSLGLGLALTQIYQFYTAVQAAILPLMLTAGMLLPMDAAPGWLYTLSRLNPLTHVVDAERALFAGDFGHPAIPLAVALTAALGAAATWFALHNIRKQSA